MLSALLMFGMLSFVAAASAGRRGRALSLDHMVPQVIPIVNLQKDGFIFALNCYEIK